MRKIAQNVGRVTLMRGKLFCGSNAVRKEGLNWKRKLQMGINLSQLSDKQRALIAPKDRAVLGKAAETFADAQKRGEARSERELQRQIVNLLRLRGIEVLWHRTDKKSHATVGWPDLTFSIYSLAPQHTFAGESKILPKAWQRFPCVWEVKLPGKKLDPHQEAMAKRMKTWPNYWCFRIITSVYQAREELTKLGLA